jgi:hypothetical protein
VRALPAWMDAPNRVTYAGVSLGLLLVQDLVAWLILETTGRHGPLEWWVWFDPLRAIAMPHFIATPQPLPAPAVLLGGLLVTLAADAGLTMLALARARRIGDSEGLAALAFVPFLQTLVILWLTVIPERRAGSLPKAAPDRSHVDARTLVEGLLTGAVLSVVAVAFSTLVLGLYGYWLFVLAPFFAALSTAYLANRRTSLSIGSSIMAGLAALFLGAVGLVGFALEGVFCLIVASPLIAGMGVVGAWTGRALALRGKSARRSTAASVAITPLLLIAEIIAPPHAGFDSAESVEVNAPAAAVWDAVVHMGPIPDAPAPPFRWGLAYPVRGEIYGEGVGAIRRGVFSTGVAYERVTEWRPDHALSFIVLSDPPTMRELSPHAHVHAPHVNGYFRTLDACFTLTPLANGHTRLTLATRHELDLQPALYWIPFAEWAVHANKVRVLEHFRRQAEGESGAGKRSTG